LINEYVRYVRLHADAPKKRVDADIITKGRNLTWEFSEDVVEAGKVIAFPALVQSRMTMPEQETVSLRGHLPAALQAEAIEAE
jgi:hypothetical protein